METLASQTLDNHATTPLRLDDVSLHGRIRILQMVYQDMVFGIAVMPFVSGIFTLWLLHTGGDGRRLIAWTLAYSVVAIAVLVRQPYYKRKFVQLAPEQQMGKWWFVVHAMAFANGVGIAGMIVLSAGQVSFEFVSLLYITLSVVIAANATHQSPVLSAFWSFFAVSWGVTTVASPWAFPDHWPIVLALMLVYFVAIYRHALVTNRFYLRQVWLEEESLRLAERYRAAKDEAEAALRAKNQFLTTASHDLRQPVHAMGFLIEAIAKRNRDESLIPALRDLRRSVNSVNQMFNSLLDLSKIESGVVKVRSERIWMDGIMNDITAVFQEEARVRNLHLRVRLPRSSAIVSGDPMLLRQAMINLMHNALRYTLKGGVLMAVRKRSGHWQFEVWDTGIGVALEEQARIYSPFYRNEHAWRVDSAGHGLGLALVARCAELMGAQCGLSSREGRGSRFWLRLPAAVASERASERETKPVEALDHQGGTLRGTCLIVDDDPEVCTAQEALLASWGIQVRCAPSASLAFRHLENGFVPEAVFCDQRLRSGESGFDVLRELLKRCSAAKGAMISGEFDSPELKQAEHEGYLVLRKPLEPQQLFAILREWLTASV